MFKQSHKEPQQVNNISTLNFTREKGKQKHTSHYTSAHFPIFFLHSLLDTNTLFILSKLAHVQTPHFL